MSDSPAQLSRASLGDAVRDLQERLAAVGYPIGADAPGDFGPGTDVSVRTFQEKRGLHVDGIVGPETWGALVESAFRLGDRLLYLRRPMLRGDDVCQLQRRLNALGFDAGREDGIFGPETDAAVRQFQRNAGVASDGVAGPATRSALERLGTLSAGSVAHVRERELLRHPGRLGDRRVYLAVEPGLASLGTAVARLLTEAGALVALDPSGQDDSGLAAEANAFDAGVFVALRAGAPAGFRCVFFAKDSFRSEAGYCLARHLDHELGALLGPSDGPVGRNYALLRETRMAAVICEIVPRDNASAMEVLVARASDIAQAVGHGIQRGVEAPLDAPA